jgi:chromatin remodeling complex protein RSC6
MPDAKRKPNPALMKKLDLSPTLQAVTGPGQMSRGQVMKKVWEYIKAKGLQDSVNKRNINADEKLKVLFGGKSQVNMFEMAKLISTHVSDPDKKPAAPKK